MGAGKSLKRKVAAKVCKETDDPDRDDAMREVEVMRALGQHRHIVQLIGYTQVNDGDVTIVLEYCEKGNLLNYLRKEVRQNMELASKAGTLPSLIRQLTTIGAHISDGMMYLSSKNYVHRDLATRNILLTSDMTAKISDFGLCRYADEQLYRARHARKLPVKWMAPESLRSMEFSTKSDVWSFGILMWEVFTCGDVPFHDTPNADTLEALDAGERPACPCVCPTEIYQFMRQCWSSMCQERPTFEDAYSFLLRFANSLQH
ncbi:Protein F09A5.2 [Aphelenchoides avenae]|nr:Protein F09A5.2 [Aphelenchus avenae]